MRMDYLNRPLDDDGGMRETVAVFVEHQITGGDRGFPDLAAIFADVGDQLFITLVQKELRLIVRNGYFWRYAGFFIDARDEVCAVHPNAF